MADIDYDEVNQKQGETRAHAWYRIWQDGNRVKVNVHLKVTKTGLFGDGKGVMAFALLTNDGATLFRVEKGLSVGADLSGAASKEFQQTFTLIGTPAKTFLEQGGIPAFTAEVEKDSIGISEWHEFLGEALPSILGGLGLGQIMHVGNWIVKKLKP